MRPAGRPGPFFAPRARILPGPFRARQRAERIKAHPTYTVAIGEDCRIVAPTGPPPPTQPALKAAAETDFQVRVRFAMRGHDQLELQSQRGGEADISLLAYDTNSPYLDARAPLVPGQPEVRQYRARWRDDDQSLTRRVLRSRTVAKRPADLVRCGESRASRWATGATSSR